MTRSNIVLVIGLALVASFATFATFKSLSSNDQNHQLLLTYNELYSSANASDYHVRLQEFSQWKITHSKQYTNSELATRFRVWNLNYDIVQEHNSKNLTWTLEMNMFADLTPEEFSALHLGFNYEQAQKEDRNDEMLEENLEAPTSIDWRTKGAVSWVRNQGQCGSCWAFAVCSSLESLNYIKKRKMPNFSEQQLVDCSSSYGNQGCNGGTMIATFRYIQANGIENESSYYYKNRQGTCKYRSSKVAYRNTGYVSVPQRNPTQLRNAVASQPVTVGVQASQSSFQLYKSGVITSGCGTYLDHAITVVGYDRSNGVDSWIARNQWGASWGDKGYVRIARGTQNGGAGMCGINQMASYAKY